MNKKVLQKLTAITTAAVLAASIAPMGASAAWNKDANANWSWTENGQKSTGWKMIHGNWYYFDGSGVMQTGWKFIDGQWYYMDQSGAMKTGWQFINGEWYHLGTSGAMTKGWYQEGSTWYHLNENGVMSRNWRKISNKWYHFNPSGQMSTGWINWKNNRYFSDKDGAMQAGLVQIDNKVYYFDEVTGEMQTGRIKIGNVTYTFGEDGAATGAILPKAEVAFDADGNEKTPGGVVSGGETTAPSRPSYSGGGSSGGGSSYVEVQSISLNKSSHIMYVGDDVFLTASIYPSNATNKTVTWISSDESIATVTNGYVHALKEGTVTIKAIADTAEATCKVEIMAKGGAEDVKVTGITVSSTSGAKSAHVGETLQLQAAVTPANASNKAVTWSSKDKSIASVDANGLVTGVKEGKTTITATAKDGSGVSGTFDVEITKKPATESATPTFTKDLDTAKEATVGDNVTLSVTASASDGGTLSYQWYKNDKAISGATSASYTFTADATGTASYKVVVTNKKGSLTPATATSKTCVVTTKAAPVSDVEITGYVAVSPVIVAEDKHFTTAAMAAANLPSQVTLNYDGGSVAVDVTWACDSYDPASAEAQTFTASYTLPSGYVDAVDPIAVTATVTLEVAQTEPPVVPEQTTVNYAATGTPVVKFVNGSNKAEELAKVSYAGGKFTVAGGVTSFSFVDNGVAKKFTNTDDVWSDAEEISKSLIFGATFTTDVERDNFGYFSNTYDNPMFTASLTDGEVPPSADCSQFGYVTFASTKPDGVNKDICFNLAEEVTFKQINIDLLKQRVWEDADGYPEHVTIEANVGGVWATIGDVTGLDTTGTDGTAKTLVFTADEAITTSALRFTFYARQGNARAVILTGIDVLAETDGSSATGELAVPNQTAEVPNITTNLEATKNVSVGDSVELTIEASVSDGGTLSYQWYKDGVAISGANSATYRFVAFAAETATYKVEVLNKKEGMLSSMVTSNECVVTSATDLVNIAKGASYTLSPSTLNFAGAAADDGVKLTDDVTPNSSNYGDAGFVTTHIGSGDITTLDIVIDLGSEKSFKQVTIDTLKGTDGVNPIETGNISYSTNGTDWVDLGAINHTHGDVGIETILVAAEAPVSARYVKVSVDNANRWRSLAEIRVWGEGEETPPSDAAATPIVALNQEENLTLKASDSFYLRANASVTDGGTLSYQWYKDDVAIDGATQKLIAVTNVDASCVYKVVVTNTVEGKEPVTTAKEVNVTVDGKYDNLALNKTYTYTSGKEPIEAYPDTDNKELTDGNIVTELSYSNAGYAAWNNVKNGELVIDLGEAKDISKVNVVMMSTATSGLVLQYEVQVQYSNDNATWTDLGTKWTNDNGQIAGTVVASVVGEANARYVKVTLPAKWWGDPDYGMRFVSEVMVLGTDSTTPPVDTAAVPSIDTDLEATKAANVGDEVTFTVVASTTDEGTLSYQWYKDDVAIDGATNATYTIASATAEDAGSYKVVVTNTNGTASETADSTVCALTVETPVVSDNLIAGMTYTLEGTSQVMGDGGNSDDPDHTKLTDGVRFADPIAYNDGNSVLLKNEGHSGNFVMSFDFGKDITFKEINMGVLRISGWGIDGMTNLQIEANIGGEWKTIYNANPGNATLDESGDVTGVNNYFVAADAITASGLRFTMTRATAFMVLDEIQVMAEPTADVEKTGDLVVAEAPIVTAENVLAGETYTCNLPDANADYENNVAGWYPGHSDSSYNKLTDGHLASSYGSSDCVGWWGLQLGDLVLTFDNDTPKTFKEIMINTAIAVSDGVTPISGLKVEAKIDGVWKTVFNGNPNASTEGTQSDIYLTTDTAITATGLRFTFSGGRFAMIGEIKAMDEKTDGVTPNGTLEVVEAPVVSSNLISGKEWTSTTVEEESYGPAAFVPNAIKWLTDGEKPTPETISTATKDDCGVVLFFTNEAHPVQSFVYDLDAGKNSFKQIQISVLNQMKGSTQLGATPKTIKIEANIGGEWKTIFENAEAYSDLGANKNFVFSTDTAITADQLRFSFVGQGYGWPGVALNEIEVLADAATGAIDGTLAVADAPVEDTAAVPSIDTDLEATKAANVGDEVTFTVVASTTDEGTLSYQWYKDDVAIDGATNATYTIAPATAEDAGSYKVVVTNTNGTASETATSTVCALTVETPVVTDNLLYGIPFTTAVDHDNFAGYSNLDADPNHVNWLTDGNAPLDGSWGDKGHIAYAASGVGDADLTFAFGKEITFRQITLSAIKEQIWNPEDGIPDHITIVAQIDGAWKTILDKDGFDRSASKKFVFATDGEAITATGLKFYLYPRNGVAAAVHLTEIEALAAAGTAVDGTLAFVADEEVAYDGNPTITMVGNSYVKDGANPEEAAKVTYDSANKKFIVTGGQGITRFSFTDTDGTAKTFVKTDDGWTMSDIDNLIFGIPYTYTEGKYHDSTPDADKIKLSDGNKEVATWGDASTVGFFPDDGVAHINFDFGKSITFKEIRLGNYAGDAGIQNVRNVKIEIQKEDGTYVTILNLRGSADFGAYHEFVFNSDTAYTAKGMKLTLVGNTSYHFYNELQVLAEKSADTPDATLAEEVVETNPNLLADTSWSANTVANWAWGATTASTTLTDGVIATDSDSYTGTIAFSDSSASFTYDKAVSFKELKIYAVAPSDLNNVTPTGIKVEVYKDGVWSTVLDKQDFEALTAGKCFVFTAADDTAITADKVKITFTKTNVDGRWGGIALSEIQLFATPTGAVADATMAMPEVIAAPSLMADWTYSCNLPDANADYDNNVAGWYPGHSDSSYTKLTDGVLASSYGSADCVGWWGLHLGDLVLTFENESPITFKEVMVNTAIAVSDGVTPISGLKVEAKIDGVWKTVFNGNPNASTEGTQSDIYLTTDTAITATGLRFTFSDGRFAMIGEIKATAEKTDGVTPNGTLEVAQTEPPVVSDNLIAGVRPTIGIGAGYIANIHHQDPNDMSSPLSAEALGLLTDGKKPAVDKLYDGEDATTYEGVMYFNWYDTTGGAADFTFNFDEAKTFEQIDIAMRADSPWHNGNDGVADHIKIAAEINGEWVTIYEQSGLHTADDMGRDLVLKVADGGSITATGLKFWFYAWENADIVKGVSLAEIEAFATAKTEAVADGTLTVA